MMPQPLRGKDRLKPKEKLFSSPSSVQHSILKIYKVLMKEIEPEFPPYLGKRENELGVRLNGHQKKKILNLACSISKDVKTIEVSFRFMARWFVTQ